MSLTADVSGILPVANGGTGSSSASAARTALGVDIEHIDGMIETPTAKTYTITQSMPYACTVNDIRIATFGGTCTANIKINGTSITGLSSISVTSTPQTVSASAANTMSSGDQLTMVITAPSSAADLAFTIKETR